MEMIIEQPVNHVYEAAQPEWTETEYERRCHVCNAPSNGYHFNAPSCSACAAFFRRTVTLNRKFECSHANDCKIDYGMRVICRACRYQKCILAGMDRKAVQPRRDSIMGRRKIKYANVPRQQQQQQQTQIEIIQPFQVTKSEDKTYIVLDATALDISPFVTRRSHSISSSISSASSLTYDPLNNYIINEIPQQIFQIHQQQPTPLFINSVSSSPPPNSFENYGSNECISSATPTLPPSSPLQNTAHLEASLQHLLNEQGKSNERRRILYSERYLSEMLTESEYDDLPFLEADIRPLKFMEIRRETRSMILLTFEWLRGWPYFSQFSTADKKILFRRCVLYHTIIDPAYLTLKIGYPNKFIMSNGMYVSMSDTSETGWEDENEITSEIKKMIYMPLMHRVINEIIKPMKEINLTSLEFCVLKALISWKGSFHLVSPNSKEILKREMDILFASLHHHYVKQQMNETTIAERMGNLVLLVSNVFCVGLECIENHHKVEFFDLWQLDSLLIKLLKVGM